MTYQQIKMYFNSEWINKMCDDLANPSPFIERNKIQVLETLQTAISNNFDSLIPIFQDQREAYLFVSDCIEKEKDVVYA